MVDVIVIGAGIAGLSAAALLAKAGFEVNVFEKSQFLGGRATTLNMNGYLIDFGSHICPSGQESEVCKLIQFVGAQEVKVYPFEDMLIYFKEKLRKESQMIGSGAPRKAVDRVYSEMSTMTFEQTEALDNVTFKNWIEERIYNEEAKEFFFIHSYIMTSLGDPSEQSAGCVIRRFQDWICSGIRAGYPEGGFISFSNSLAEKIRGLGGKIYTSTAIKKVVVENNEAKKIIYGKDNKELSSKIIISSLPIWENFKLIPEEEFPVWFVKRVHYLEDESYFAGIGLVAGLNKPLYKEKAYISVLDTPINHTTLQLWQPSNFTSSIVPPGKHLLTGGQIVEPYHSMTRKRMNYLAKNSINEILELFPDYNWEKNCEWFQNPVLPKRLIDGVHRRPYQVWKQKPDVVGPIKNLYFCGDTVKGTGCGIDAPVRSAKIAVNAILQKI
ncbi:MAG: phytoene desaturase family protein [Promethearchaeota archaeon]